MMAADRLLRRISVKGDIVVVGQEVADGEGQRFKGKGRLVVQVRALLSERN